MAEPREELMTELTKLAGETMEGTFQLIVHYMNRGLWFHASKLITDTAKQLDFHGQSIFSMGQMGGRKAPAVERVAREIGEDLRRYKKVMENHARMEELVNEFARNSGFLSNSKTEGEQ